MSNIHDDKLHGQIIIINKLLNILNINETNKILSLSKIDNDIDIQNKILDLYDDANKYFNCNKWTHYKNKNRQMKRKYLSFIKNIFKNSHVKMISTVKVNSSPTDPKKKICETYYFFEF
jgi:hypothetical protein